MSAQAEAIASTGDVAVEANGELFTHLSGRVVPYDAPTDVGWFVESFARGAFTASLVRVDGKVPLLLWHDNRSFPIGLAQDWDDLADGLVGRFRLTHTAAAQEAGRLARDDFLAGMSVGFTPIRSSWSYAAEWDPDLGPDHMDHVTRHEARLIEVSLTPTPAYPDAVVTDVEAEARSATARPALARAALWRRRLAGRSWT